MPDPVVKTPEPAPKKAEAPPAPAETTVPPAPARYKVLKPCARGLEPGQVVAREAFAPKATVYVGEGKPGAPLPDAEAEAATDAAIARLLSLGVIQPAE